MISGYYTNASPPVLIAFPKARRYGGDELGIERGAIELETDRGKRWVYNLFERRVLQLDFRITLAQLAVFQTLDSVMVGNATAFYFVPDVSAPSVGNVYVRKEKDFKPKEHQQGVLVSGAAAKLFDYSLILTQEPTAAAVLA